MKKLSYLILLALIISLGVVDSVLADGLGQKMKGKILLQVEQNGEAWYVNPADEKRYFMGRPADAFSMMRKLGVGISNNDIAKIEIGDNKGDDGVELLNIEFSKKQAGKILLQVEKNGEAWYVNPDDNKRYFLNRPSDAFKVMRQLGLGISNQNIEKIVITEAQLSVSDAKEIASKFIKTLIQSGTEIVSLEVVKESGLFKLTIELSNNNTPLESYLSLDGKKFFPAVLDIAEEEKKMATMKYDEVKKVEAKVVKSDKPEVELYVMSHCPFGTQMEKGIIPVIETLGDEVDFKLKFNDYAMHGKKELDEQLTQYCIGEKYPEKLLPYLKCFLEDETFSDKCIKENAIDASAIEPCVISTDEKYKVTEMFNDKSTWANGRFPKFNVHADENGKYGVSGSPSLVINGQKINSARNSTALLTTICSAFNEKPAECETELSPVNPSSGFGYSGSSGGSASCGS